MATPTYATHDEVVDVLTRDGEKTSGNAGSLDEEPIAKAIIDAQAEIDARLAARYTVPFVPVPQLINTIAQDIAAYLADLVFRENRDYQTDLSPIYLRYQRAQTLLGGLQTGEIRIPPDGEDPPGADTGSRVVTAITRSPLFTSCDFDIYPRVDDPPYWTPEGWAIH